MTDFSVIIPVKNGQKYIERSLLSVLNQTYTNNEIIVVDGHSTDNTANLIRKYESHGVRLLEQPTIGVSEARNYGVKKSRGDYLAFLDADDEWLPWHLECIDRLIHKFPTCGMYTTTYQIQTKDNNRIANYANIPKTPVDQIIPNYFLSAVKGEFPVYTSSVCIPRSIYSEVGGFTEGYSWGEDADLFGKIAIKYPVAFSWVMGATYHWDNDGRACEKPNLVIEPFVYTARTAINQGNVSDEHLVYVKEYINKKELYRASCLMYCGEPVQARSVLAQCDTTMFRYKKSALYLMTFFPQPILRNLLKARFGFA